MSTHNFINIIKMPNLMIDFRRFLQLLSPEQQLYEINFMIHEFDKSNRTDENIRKEIRILNELTTLKKEIIINHKERLQNY